MSETPKQTDAAGSPGAAGSEVESNDQDESDLYKAARKIGVEIGSSIALGTSFISLAIILHGCLGTVR